MSGKRKPLGLSTSDSYLLRISVSDFGEGFRVYLISLVFQEFCSRNKLRLCFSTDQGSENPLVFCNLTVFASDQFFSGLGVGFLEC